MKKTIFYTALLAITAGSIFTSCDSKEKNVEEAKEEVKEADQNLDKAQVELNAEYPAYKTNAEVRIASNENRIVELKVILNKPGKLPLDNARKKRIEELEERNAQLRSRLNGYETQRSDWESFKREFNHACSFAPPNRAASIHAGRLVPPPCLR